MNMTTLRILLLGASLILTVRAVLAADTVTPLPSEGERIVADLKAVFTAPPRRIPSNCAVDAPLMGNGDLLAALGGGPERPTAFINKNDLWFTNQTGGSRPAPLARLDLELPGLKDASYRVEQNLLRGITTGSYTTGDSTLTLETAVSATENLLWVKLSADRGTFLGRATLSLPGQAQVSAGPLTGGTGHIQLGREQYGNGRWYFDGAMDGVVIYDHALSEAEIQKLAKGEASKDGLLRSWDFGSDGTATGAQGKAMVFDGRTTFVDSPPLKPGPGLTVGAFVKANRHSSSGNAQYLVSQGEWSKDWSLGIREGKVRLALNGQFAESAGEIPLGKWVHVAGTYDGKTLRVFLEGKDADPRPVATAGSQFVQRRFDEKERLFPTAAACAMRVVTGAVGDDGSFKVSPGEDVLIVVAAASLRESKEFSKMAASRAADFKADDLIALKSAHEKWWQGFWARSFIEIPDKELEQRYYLSHYALACASRLAAFPPDLYGWETTDAPMWGGAVLFELQSVRSVLQPVCGKPHRASRPLQRRP